MDTTPSMTPCSFVRYSDGSTLDPSKDGSPVEVRRAALQQIAKSLLQLARTDRGIFEVMVPVSNVVTADVDRHGYNLPVATRVRAHLSSARSINRIVVEGPDQGIFQPRAEYRLFDDGGVMIENICAVSNNMMLQISCALAHMTE